jgi:hypothetical protein
LSELLLKNIALEKRMETTQEGDRPINVFFHLLNLYERPDRLEQSLNQLRSIELSDCIRIMPVIKIHQQRRRQDGNGKLGCFLGHRNIWNDIATNESYSSKDLHIICEDDISVDYKNFQNAIQTAISESQRWDIFCFGWFPLSTRRDDRDEHLRRIRFGGMAHCYAVSQRWVRVHRNAPYPGYNHDLWMFMDKKDGWNVIGYVPMVAFQSDQEQNLITGETPISDISPRMYQTRALWWKLCPLEKTLSLSEKANYFVWFIIIMFVLVIFLLLRKRRFLTIDSSQ